MLAFTLTACNQPTKKVVFDNPSNKEVAIKIDDFQVVTLAPNETKFVPIKFGKRTLAINNKAPIDIILEKENDYLINPLQETYYIRKLKYFASKRDEERYNEKFPPKKSWVENYEVEGEFEKVNTIVIKKTWTFGINDAITKGGRGTSRKGYLTASKIYRKKQLVDEISPSILNPGYY